MSYTDPGTELESCPDSARRPFSSGEWSGRLVFVRVRFQRASSKQQAKSDETIYLLVALISGQPAVSVTAAAIKSDSKRVLPDVRGIHSREAGFCPPLAWTAQVRVWPCKTLDESFRRHLLRSLHSTAPNLLQPVQSCPLLSSRLCAHQAGAEINANRLGRRKEWRVKCQHTSGEPD